MILRIFAICTMTMLLAGCVTKEVKMGDFTLVTTKNVNLTNGKLSARENVSLKEMASNEHPILYLSEVISHAMEQDPCVVALSDAVFYNVEDGWGNGGYRVEGRKVIDKTRYGCEDR